VEGIFPKRAKANPPKSPFFKGGFNGSNLFKNELLFSRLGRLWSRFSEKDFPKQGDRFFGGKLFPYLAEPFPPIPFDMRLELIDLSEDKQELGVNELTLPVISQGIDERPREDGVLDLSEAVLDLHHSFDKGIKPIVVGRSHELTGIAELLHLDPEAMKLLEFGVLQHGSPLFDSPFEFLGYQNGRHLPDGF
jgi:hypothetical protein